MPPDIDRPPIADPQPDEVLSLLRMATKLSRLGAWSVQIPGMQLTWSDEVRAIHEVPADYTPDVPQGIGFYAPEHRSLISDAVTRCIDEGVPFDLELQIVTAKGRRVWVRALGEALRDPSGQVVKVQGAFQDISRSRELAEQNRELASRLADTLDSMGDAFFTLDRDWRFTYVNHQAEQLMNHRRDDLLGRLLWDVYPEVKGSPFHAAYEKAIADNLPVEVEEYYAPLDKWFNVRAYPSRFSLAVYFRDATASVRARDALRRVNEDLHQRVEVRTRELNQLAGELESFSSSVAHDLRAPLGSIAGYAQVLTERYADKLDEAGLQYLRKVGAASQRMEEMISAVLALARLPQATLAREQVDLSQAARVILARLAGAAPERNVTVQVQEGLQAFGDRALLEQVLESLLANAWKFTSRKEHATITVGAQPGPAETVYFVDDDGAGFDMAHADRLFQMFSRQHHVSEFPGNGVGLATVKSIVSRHGGRAWADSRPGIGTRISFTLPAPPGV